jgi:hypothetical protein
MIPSFLAATGARLPYATATISLRSGQLGNPQLTAAARFEGTTHALRKTESSATESCELAPVRSLLLTGDTSLLNSFSFTVYQLYPPSGPVSPESHRIRMYPTLLISAWLTTMSPCTAGKPNTAVMGSGRLPLRRRSSRDFGCTTAHSPATTSADLKSDGRDLIRKSYTFSVITKACLPPLISCVSVLPLRLTVTA